MQQQAAPWSGLTMQFGTSAASRTSGATAPRSTVGAHSTTSTDAKSVAPATGFSRLRVGGIAKSNSRLAWCVLCRTSILRPHATHAPIDRYRRESFEPPCAWRGRLVAERLATRPLAPEFEETIKPALGLLRALDDFPGPIVFLWASRRNSFRAATSLSANSPRRKFPALASREKYKLPNTRRAWRLCVVHDGDNYVQFIQAYSRERGISLPKC